MTEYFSQKSNKQLLYPNIGLFYCCLYELQYFHRKELQISQWLSMVYNTYTLDKPPKRSGLLTIINHIEWSLLSVTSLALIGCMWDKDVRNTIKLLHTTRIFLQYILNKHSKAQQSNSTWVSFGSSQCYLYLAPPFKLYKKFMMNKYMILWSIFSSIINYCTYFLPGVSVIGIHWAV